MSPANSASENIESVFGNSLQKTKLDLNELFRQVMQKFSINMQKREVIVRCDTLPSIHGNKTLIARLFEYIVGMIVSHALLDSKFFLYVSYEEEKVDKLNGIKYFILKFHTNVIINSNWKEINKQAFMECERILSDQGGVLLVNNIGKTGCLFSISLPVNSNSHVVN